MSTSIDASLLGGWPLPHPGGSKYERGQLLVVGGAQSAPGAAILAGTAALRVGAGRLTLAVAEAVAAQVAVALPESAVLDVDDIGEELSRADAVLIGPGLVDAEHAVRLCDALIPRLDDHTTVVLDAFALGVLPRLRSAERLRGRLVLTPNREEAAILLDRDPDDETPDLGAIADKYGAVVTCFGQIADPGARRWHTDLEAEGIGTSGSGDVLAGAIAGLCARGADPAQAAVWGTWLHLRAGQLAGTPPGALGYLARELADALPPALSGALDR